MKLKVKSTDEVNENMFNVMVALNNKRILEIEDLERTIINMRLKNGKRSDSQKIYNSIAIQKYARYCISNGDYPGAIKAINESLGLLIDIDSGIES